MEGILSVIFIGLIITSIAIGNMYQAVHGWLVLGIGFIVIGIIIGMLCYLTPENKGESS